MLCPAHPFRAAVPGAAGLGCACSEYVLIVLNIFLFDLVFLHHGNEKGDLEILTAGVVSV